MWGQSPEVEADLQEVFVKYMSGTGEVKILPWSLVPICPETSLITEKLVELNKRGFWTINSQVDEMPLSSGCRNSS